MFYVVVYDIPCNRRRSRVHKLLSGYGCWVQFSVFELAIAPRKFEELRGRLRGRVNLAEDSVRFYPVSGHTLGQDEAWGVGAPVTRPRGSTIV